MLRRRLGFGWAMAVAAILGVLVLAGGARGGPSKPAWADGPVLAPVSLRLTPDGCKQRCPEVDVDSLTFVDAPALTAALRGRLIALAAWAAETDPTAGVADYPAYAERLFALDAAVRDDPEQAAYSAYLAAERVDRHAGVSVFRLDADVFTGGAHGMPMTAFWLVDEHSGRSLSNADLLAAGSAARLEAALRAAHARWQAEQPDDLSAWPFVMPEQLAPRANGLEAVWQAYAIAPYSYGQPRLRLDYDALGGILRPRFLAGRAQPPAYSTASSAGPRDARRR